jgi:hypothetical protein
LANKDAIFSNYEKSCPHLEGGHTCDMGSNSNGKTTMDIDASDPTKNAELERFTAEHAEKVKQANIDILLWNENDYLCKNFIFNCFTDHLYDLYLIRETAKNV